MANYTHLSMRERCLITHFLSMKAKIDIIAERTGRHRSTIYRELKRNTQGERYMPSIAHDLAKKRHPHASNKLQTNIDLNNYVRVGLENGWSPEQISGRMKIEKQYFYVCAESIYRFIYRNKNLGLYKFLPRRQAKRYARYERNKHKRKQQMLMRHINLRAPEANLRSTIGHWEGDTIRFPKDQKTCVTTLVDRKSRFLFLRKNENKKSGTVIDHIFNAIKKTPKKIWASLTFDQGSEFMEFRKIERQTNKTKGADKNPWIDPSSRELDEKKKNLMLVMTKCKFDAHAFKAAVDIAAKHRDIALANTSDRKKKALLEAKGYFDGPDNVSRMIYALLRDAEVFKETSESIMNNTAFEPYKNMSAQQLEHLFAEKCEEISPTSPGKNRL